MIRRANCGRWGYAWPRTRYLAPPNGGYDPATDVDAVAGPEVPLSAVVLRYSRSVIRYEFKAQRAIASSPEEVMRWLGDPGLMARWIVGAEGVEPEDGHVRLTVATRVARWHVAATYTGETVERTSDRFVRRYIDDQDEVSIDRTVTYELAPTPAGCQVTCSVITDVEGVSPSIVRASRRQQQKSLRRSLRRLALLVTGREPTRWGLSVDRRQTGQPL